MTPAHPTPRALLPLLLATALLTVAGACSSDDDASPQNPWQLSEPAPQPEPGLPRQPDPQPQPEPQPEPTAPMEELTGRWMLYDTYPRGGITADVFTLRADGTRALELQYDPAGVVYECGASEDAERCRTGEARTCKLGDTWRAWREDEGSSALYLEFLSRCSDGEPRAVVFALDVIEDSEVWPGSYGLKTTRVGDATRGWHLIGFDGTFDSTYVLTRCDVFDETICPKE